MYTYKKLVIPVTRVLDFYAQLMIEVSSPKSLLSVIC